ncbi:PssD/Cps14F family polysaccharide biosynthesis glycosyltransferase [Clostridium paridis]|uniref:Polysaccharide biosynthesis protein n=1 Tax=Clostridium paridis TaxID=2803863 RepID=A0A937FIB4_9CLOT|nr:PssD/Cps14F family polysaccharide biosynthesis glycosyltransferase [Clostridium paridis]MBL4932628.1 polysaccharide biosynthesis protein [Clostridium paridis]
MKICFTASSGGHFEQLMMLKPIMDKNESFVITEKTQYQPSNSKNIYYLKQVNRKESGWVLKFIANTYRTFKILNKENPDVVISTGALSTVPVCLLGKLKGKKVIFIESFAKISTQTLSGKIVYKFADLFIIQWEQLKEFYPNAVYGGGIY